jgi:hypothetical protein
MKSEYDWGYTQVVPDLGSKIMWHSSKCGWVVVQDTTVAPPPPVVLPACEDNNAAANFAFGHLPDSDDYVEDICEVASSSWGMGGYCDNLIFAAMCQASCKVSTCQEAGAQNAAAKEYLKMLGLPTTAASSCSDLDCSSSPIVAAICPSTCATSGRRLAAYSESSPAYAVHEFRQQMADMYLNSLKAREGSSAGRRLDDRPGRGLGFEAGSSYNLEEVYYTFSSTLCPAGSPDPLLLDMPVLYDIKAFVQPTPIAASVSCPAATYFTSTYTGSFCRHQNVQTAYNTIPEIVDNNCYRKCTVGKPKPIITVVNGTRYVNKQWPNTWNTQDNLIMLPGSDLEYVLEGEDVYHQGNAASPDGNDWCAGNDETFVEGTNALCLPREECERLCDLLGDDCVSIDMHRKFPRCYLNTACDEAEASYEYDILVKQRTPDETTEVDNSDARISWTTITGKKSEVVTSGGGVLLSQGERTRGQCEDLCKANPICFGFEFVSNCAFSGPPAELTQASCKGTGVCSLYNYAPPHIEMEYLEQKVPDITGVIPQLDTEIVLKEFPIPCTSTVTGSGIFDGVYTYLSSGIFMSPTNMTRVSFKTKSGVKYECDGWVLENSLKEESMETLYNCSDAPTPTSLYFTITPDPDVPIPTLGPNQTGPPNITYIGAKDFPCQWGADEGYCDTDITFAALCHHTCTPFLTALIGGKTYKYHGMVPCDPSDHDAAMVKFAQAQYPGLLAGGDMCSMMVGTNGPHYNYTHSPCHYGPLAPIIQVLCMATCGVTPQPFEQVTTPLPTDEASPGGSSKRKLYHEPPPPPLPLTLSYGGPSDGVLTIKYMCADGCPGADGKGCGFCSGGEDAKWTDTFRSYKNGSSVAFSYPDITSACPALSFPAISKYNALRASTWYPTAIPVAQDVTLGRVCRTAAACPELTTCVLSRNRFAEELAGLKPPGVLARSEWVASLGTKPRADVLGMMVPKTIITEMRADAVIAGAKSDVVSMLYTSRPGGTMLRFPPKQSDFGDLSLVTLVPSLAQDGGIAELELGRTYAIPGAPFYTPFLTDIVRVERFAAGSALVEGPFLFDMYVPGVESLIVFVFPMYGEAVELTAFGGSVTPLSGGYFQVMLPSTGVDVVAVGDIDECLAGPCSTDATCANNVGAPPTCTCKEGFVEVMAAGKPSCALKPEVYDSASQEYYFRLKHNDRMDYGWRVKELQMFTDPACVSKYGFQGDISVPGNYPGPYAARKMLDGVMEGSEWWSEDLNLNPEVVDETHGGAVTMEWVVPGDVVIECVSIFQNVNHMSKDMTLERGPTSGKGCGMGSMPRCPPTMVWHAKPTGTRGDFKTECGEANTQYFGEVLVLPQTSGAGWYGSYADTAVADPVPSACHCAALCVAHIGEGCRSYKFYDQGGVKHCYLQSNIFSKGEGYWGVEKSKGQWTGWRSGTPGLRVLGFSPGEIVPGAPFTLEITGVELPYNKDENYNTAPRQRVKIMQTGQKCKEQPPAEVSGIGCTETLRKVATAYGVREELVYTICSPRPLAADDESVSFGPLTITAAAEDVEYKVCYCTSQCYEPSSYKEIPGSIKLASSTFLYSLPGGKVFRKSLLGPTALQVLVERPSFGSFSNALSWELKVVRDYFGCGVLTDPNKFKCMPAAMAPPDPFDMVAPAITFDTMNLVAANMKNLTAPTKISIYGTWMFGFTEKITTAGCSGGWVISDVAGNAIDSLPCSEVITSGSMAYVKFATLPSNTEVVVSWTEGAVVDTAVAANKLGAGNTTEIPIPGEPKDEFGALFKPKFRTSSALPVTPEVVTSTPVNGGQDFGLHSVNNVTFYTSLGSITGVGNLTVLDCGGDGACGTKDDVFFAESEYTLAWADNKISFLSEKDLLFGHRFQIMFEEGSIVSAGGIGPADVYIYEFMAGCPLPNYLLSPDKGSWMFGLDLEVEDVGQYAICFREQGGTKFAPIPSEMEKYMTVNKIAADRTHPRGIFHNQYFSTLAGTAQPGGSMTPINLTVAGTRVPVPTDSKIAITKGTKCGATSDFKGVETYKAKKPDIDAPVVDFDNSYPKRKADGSAAGISTQQAIMLKFNEAVQTGPLSGCRGQVSFCPTTSPTCSGGIYRPCTNLTADKDKVLISPYVLNLGDTVEYYLRIDTGAIMDMAGNDLPIINSVNDNYLLSTDSSASDQEGPQVIGHFPSADSDSNLVFYDYQRALGGATYFEDTIVLYMSESFVDAGITAYVTLTDCGTNKICEADDAVINYYLVSSLVSSVPDNSFNRIYIDTTNITSFRRYSLTVPANSFSDGTLTGPSSPYTFEFEKVDKYTNFQHARKAVPASGASEQDGLVFGISTYDMRGEDGGSPGTFTMCYCDDQKDSTLEVLGDGDTTYKLYDDVKCGMTPYPTDAELYVVANIFIPEHQCEAKCSKGCTGPFCFCSGYDTTATSETLCLSPALCREACDAIPDCGGIQIHDDLPQCVLLKEDSACVGAIVNGTAAAFPMDNPIEAEDWQLYTKLAGSACTHLSDFTERAGTLFITNRVEVSVDYVLHPGEAGSIELTSPSSYTSARKLAMSRKLALPLGYYYYYYDDFEPSLTYDHSPVFGFPMATSLLSKDRITIIDCKGTCGVSSPTTALVLPEGAEKISTWNDLYPHSWFSDSPHVDKENPKEADKTLDYKSQMGMQKYSARDGFYCYDANINLDEAKVPWEGTMKPLKDYQCYAKCASGGGEGCSGLYSGFDGPESNALCLDQQMCQYVCDQLGECGSIDMHKSRDRCFLNKKSECETHTEQLLMDPNYVLLIKGAEYNDEQAGTTADAFPRELGTDYGFSWGDLLRFKPVQFKSGGTFKLCFCDATLTADGVCMTEKDYKIEVGTIHASGVSCLIADPKLQRVSCTPQAHGGLRCYEHMDAPMPEAPQIGVAQLPTDEMMPPLDISTLCMFMPEEEARLDPRCQTSAGFQSTGPLRKKA